MLSDCYPETTLQSNGQRCPQSGSVGSTVDLQTVKALLTERALSRLTPGDYRFCPDAGCEVVYFDGERVRFSAEDIRVPVWQKLPFGTRPICYCFGETETSIRAECETRGRSQAVARIRAHIAAGRCACEVRNPRGACCLGDVIAAVKRVEQAVATASRAKHVAEADVDEDDVHDR